MGQLERMRRMRNTNKRLARKAQRNNHLDDAGLNIIILR
jgi:hypothetical protein